MDSDVFGKRIETERESLQGARGKETWKSGKKFEAEAGGFIQVDRNHPGLEPGKRAKAQSTENVEQGKS